jgi:hypothetical protein
MGSRLILASYCLNSNNPPHLLVETRALGFWDIIWVGVLTFLAVTDFGSRRGKEMVNGSDVEMNKTTVEMMERNEKLTINITLPLSFNCE